MKMYFKICLLSPVWLPLVLGALLLMLNPILGQESVIVELLKGASFLTGAALLFGGVQYLIALVIVWRRVDFDRFENIVRGCLALPIVFTPIQLLGVSFLMFGDGWGALDTLGGLGAMDLIFGYAYVLLWFVGYGLLTLFRKMRGGVYYG